MLITFLSSSRKEEPKCLDHPKVDEASGAGRLSGCCIILLGHCIIVISLYTTRHI